MRLSQYLEERKMTDAAFARLIEVSSEAVRRYKLKRVPQPDVMRKIVEATGGQVQPNDFFPDMSDSTKPSASEAA